MKRNRLMCLTALCVGGVCALALSAPSLADVKEQDKAAVQDVAFACSQHGPVAMTLTLKLETGTPTGSPRKIEFIGGPDTTKWVVKIDGQFAQDGSGGTNGDTVKVRSGDSITWSFASKKHGVAFAEKAAAQAMLEFDTVFKPLVDQNTNLNTNAWMMFGNNRWGTDPTTDLGIFASCKVK